MSRIEKAKKNIFFSYLGTIVSMLLRFIIRTVFIYFISIEYLGVNGLYTNILATLSFADLGIGAAMNYSLYKPVAENDKEKIKSLLHLYKVSYRWIAMTILLVGLGLVPFLKYLIKDPGVLSQSELVLYYIIFLLNTVTSYLISYKYSIANAEQKNYIETNIKTITKIIIAVVQIIVLFFTRNYLTFILVDFVMNLAQKIFVSFYMDKIYPILKEKNISKLAKEEKASIVRNVKGLIVHKIGTIVAYNTDYIIISAFINVSTVGIVSNYDLIITAIITLLSVGFNSLISTFGNIIATENEDVRYESFMTYRFTGLMLYGFATISLCILLNPFVNLWAGSKMVISEYLVVLLVFNFYIRGARSIVENYKTSAGIFYEDRYVPIIESTVDMAISLFLVQRIGIAGVYIGTIFGRAIPFLIKPFIVYRMSFNKHGALYFVGFISNTIKLLIPLGLLLIIKYFVFNQPTLTHFIALCVSIVVVYLLFVVIFYKDNKYLKKIINRFIKKK